MATITRVNGSAGSIETVGRDLQFFTIGQSDITAAELEAIISAITTLGFSVEVIGAVTFGTSDTVNVILSGNSKLAASDLQTAAAAAVAGTTVVDLAF
jgi:hypothetical protein